MTDSHLFEEADECRKRAQAYVGQPEATFLLKIAREFELLAREGRREQRGSRCDTGQAKICH
jgi:hypothetical protein